jgi:iron complex transport system substrate-binding protein
MRWTLALVLTHSLFVATPTYAEARRIISLAPSVTELLFALSVGSRVVGVSTYCDYPPEAARIDKVGTFLSPNTERILVKKPDLVIAVPSPGNRSAVEAIRDLGVPVLVVDPQSVASILESVRTIAEAVGVVADGRSLQERIQNRLAAVRARLIGVTRRTVVMAVDHRPLIVVGAGTYQDELIELAGGINLGARAGDQWPHVGVEFVVAQAPQVIIDTTMGGEGEETADFWRPLTTIPAVRARRIHGAHAFVLLRPGPRVVEGVETMARFIHPERFPNE